MWNGKNMVFQALRPEAQQKLLAVAERCELRTTAPLYHSAENSSYVYFLEHGVTSIIVRGTEGTAGGITLAGCNSAIGAEALLGRYPMEAECFLHTVGRGFRVPVRVCRKLVLEDQTGFEPLYESVQRHLLMTQRTATCNMIHTTNQRLAQWLLMFSDLSGSAEVPVTQEMMANLLSVQRTTMSLVSNELEQAQLIQHARGRITIIDRERLERMSCDCYEAWQRLNAVVL